MPKAVILSKEEQKLFYTPTVLNLRQKEYYFKLPNELEIFVDTLREDKNIIYFYLLYGYFKADNIFYSAENFHKDDIEYINKKLSLNLNEQAIDLSQRHIRRYKKIINQYLLINDYTDEIKSMLLNEACTLANNFTHRKKIFYSLIKLSIKLKIEVQSYTELSRIVIVAINSQKQDILDKLAPFAKDEKFNTLDEFLQKDKEFKNRWQLSHYKKLEHATNKKKMLESLSKFNTIKTKFNITQSIIETIGLTPKIAQYHARWIEKSQVFQVKRKKDIESNFLLLSFVYYQYLIRNDNLIDRFISTVQ